MFKKILTIVAVVFTFLTSSPVLAATDNTSQIPELNPFCWKKSDCQAIRKQFGTENDPGGFVSDASVAPCTGGDPDDPWGRCLPAGQTKTEISFGGKTEFSNIGEFIILMYRYLLTIASIVAVIMIIVAGVQWTTSGGNSEAISSAKKRISGAVIGLFIGYMSYFILNTINPALVNLRLPQVWLIKPLSEMTTFCSDIKGASEGKIKFLYGADAAEQAKQITPDTAKGKSQGYIWTIPDNNVTFYCGTRLFAENGGQSACFGGSCESETGKMCTNIHEFASKDYSCEKGELIIRLRVSTNISVESLIRSTVWFDKFNSPDWLKNDPGMRIFAICEDANGKRFTPGKFNSNGFFSASPYDYRDLPVHPKNLSDAIDGPYGRYTFRLGGLTTPEMEGRCSEVVASSVLKGYFFTVEIDENNSSDEPNFNIGYRNGSTVSGHFLQDLTPDDFVPIDMLKKPGGLILDAVLDTGKYSRFSKDGENSVDDFMTVDAPTPGINTTREHGS